MTRLVLAALLSIAVAFLLTAAEAAIWRMSRVRAHELLEEGMLGDLVLCPEVAERQAVTAGHSTEAEIELLTVHGILHLLGYDHAEPEEHKEMFGLQDELLAAWRAR